MADHEREARRTARPDVRKALEVGFLLDEVVWMLALDGSTAKTEASVSPDAEPESPTVTKR